MERRTFEVDEDWQVPRLQPKRRVPLVEAGPPRRMRVLATYYDTEDLRLLAAGVSLRRRSGAGGDWLLRVPVGRATLELRVPATAEEAPPAEIQRLLTGWVGRHVLRACLTVDTDRTAAQLAAEDGTPLIELADDRTVAERVGDGRVLHWRSVRLEPLAADGGLTETLAARLVEAGARPASETLPLLVGLGDPAGTRSPAGVSNGSHGGTPPARSGRARDSKRPKGSKGRPDPIADRFRSLAVDIGGQYLLVRQESPEAIHDFRVTVRRLRSLLRTFRPHLDRQPAEALRSELGWLGDVLGRVRDAEVLEQRYDALLETVPAEEQLGPVRADLVGAVRQSRLAAETELADALDSDRYAAIVDRLHEFARRPPYRPGRDGTDGKLLRRCVARDIRRTRRRLAEARATAPSERDARYHEVRKAAKRVRYAAETLGPVAPKQAGKLQRRFKEVQGILGDRNDAVVSRRILLAEGRRTGVQPSHNGYTYGLLAERERRSIADADDAFPELWARAEKAAARWG